MQSQLEAKIYGVGQLITQRKMFHVPEHQRTFAWSVEDIENYLDDISSAFEMRDADYFIGLVVIQGIENASWQILDGQQRLATTTMIYSAIRDWLGSHNFQADADQIEKEFIGVRQLGGKYSARLRLNVENREVFEKLIVQSASVHELQESLANYKKRSSNRKIIEGELFCREWLQRFVNRITDKEKQAEFLFAFAAFLENKVKVVCVEVSTETDAYILFESLNHRGVDLSALDLVKNHIFNALAGHGEPPTRLWSTLMSHLEGKDADDFLKVFWMTQFGLVRKVNLFNRLKQTYTGPEGTRRLLSSLVSSSEKFDAIDDAEHEVWKTFSSRCRHRIADLQVLGNRQSRALLLAALDKLSSDEFESFLWVLIVFIVRYQVVGRGRTGVVEKEFARLTQLIRDESVSSASRAYSFLFPLVPSDNEFSSAFTSHIEFNNSRAQYLLLELEATSRASKATFSHSDYAQLRARSYFVWPDFIFPKYAELDPDNSSANFQIGNRILVGEDIDKYRDGTGFGSRFFQLLSGEEMELTKDVANKHHWSVFEIDQRASELASTALRTWTYPPTDSFR